MKKWTTPHKDFTPIRTIKHDDYVECDVPASACVCVCEILYEAGARSIK